MKTNYDYSAGAIENLPANEFTLDYTRGAVSWTENVNIKSDDADLKIENL